MTAKLDSVVVLQPGFRTAVNLKADLDRADKCAGYIPTEVASDILLDLGENLHVLAGRRSRLVTGTYGTGKSHLALVVANIFRCGCGSDAVSPVLTKLKSRWPGKAEKLVDERNRIEGDFLVALLEGDEGPFRDSLLRALDRTLIEAGLDEFLPETAFSAAVARLAELGQEHPEAYARAEALCREYGFPSVHAMSEVLTRKNRDAYDKFCRVHQEVCAGAQFYHHYSMEPSEVYQGVAKRLVDEGLYAGIVVLWDEFGRYMERVLDDPSAEESREIGRFAEACNASQRNQVHLYLICHRSLEEYAQISSLKRTLNLSKTQQEDLHKETGRFRLFAMKSTDSEVFDLIDQVITQRTETEEWEALAERARDWFDDWTDRSVRLKLFPEFTREQIGRMVTCGAYPLHPFAAFALPRVSERVAQNERTLFTFLSDSGSDTLGEYLHRTELPDSGTPPVMTAEELWDYFSEPASKHEFHRRTYQKYEQAANLISPDSFLERRVLRALALLLVIQSDRAPCTEEVLGFALGLQQSQMPELRETLKNLCVKSEGREAVLRQSLAGVYSFASRGSAVPLEDKVDQLVGERARLASPVGHLKAIWAELSLPKRVRATAYSDDYMLERELSVEVASPDDLAQPGTWLGNLSAGEFKDGYALFAVCEDSQQVQAVRELAATALKHPQILLGAPKEPIMCSALLRRHEALRYLEHTQANLYGAGAELREEWEALDGDFVEAISSLVSPLFNPESRMLDWFADGEELKGIVSASRLSSAASDMMYKVFKLTPRIAHERLTTEEGKDNFVGARRAIIDKLLQRDGPEQLHRETSSQHKTVVEFVYKRTGILTSKGSKYEVSRPDQSKHAEMAAVWDEIGRFVDHAKSGAQPLADLCQILRRPPYGIRVRCLSLLAAAVFRSHILRGNVALQAIRTRVSPAGMSRMDGAMLEQAFGAPENYTLEFVDIGRPGEMMVRGFAAAFGVGTGDDREPGELLPEVHDAVIKWWRGLAPFAQRTGHLEKGVLALRDRVLAPLAREDAEAKNILVSVALDILQPVEGKSISSEAVADLISRTKTALENAVADSLYPQVSEVVGQVFGGPDADAGARGEALRQWHNSLTATKKEMRFTGDAGVLTERARRESGDSASLPIGLAAEITGTPLEHWTDDMVGRLRGRLEGAKKAVEEAEVGGPPLDVPKPPKDGLVRVTIAGEGPELAATFTPVKDVSETGKNLQNILRNSVAGFKKALPSGELETILAQLLREFLR